MVPRLKTGLIYFPSVWLWGPDVLTRSSNEGKRESEQKFRTLGESAKHAEQDVSSVSLQLFISK